MKKKLAPNFWHCDYDNCVLVSHLGYFFGGHRIGYVSTVDIGEQDHLGPTKNGHIKRRDYFIRM